MKSLSKVLVFCSLSFVVMTLGLSCGSEKSSEPDTTSPAAVSDLRVESAGCDNVTLAWTAPGDDGTAGRASSYDVRYSNAAIDESNWASATQCASEPAPKVAGQAETFVVGTLTAGSTYHFALKTSDGDGNQSDLSNGPSSAVGSTTIASISDGLGADEDWATSATQLSANWAAACVDEYEYAIGTTSGGTDVVDWTSAGTQTQVTRTGLALLDEHAYFFSVRGVEGIVPGAPVFSDGVTVDINVPSSQVNALPAEVQTPVFTVTWTGSDTGSGIKHYDIQVKDGAGSWTDWLLATTLTASDFTGTIDHAYHFRSRAYDNAGNVEAYPTNPDASTAVTCAYAYLLQWGHEGTGDGEFYYPLGVAVDGLGNVYVTETDNDRVQKFDSDGNHILTWGEGGVSDGKFNFVSGAAIDDSGYVYVTDMNNNRVQKFTSTGGFVRKWGTQGTGDGELKRPRGIAVDDSGYVYVTDTDNNRIQKFTRHGAFVTEWGSAGTGDGQFNGPYGIAVGPSGSVYVVDMGNNRVQEFTSDGSFLAKWGSFGSTDGKFNTAMYVAIDQSGHVYVAEANGMRVQRFTSDGIFLTKWGSPGTGGGQFDYCAGIAVATDGSVYVVDMDNLRVEKFGATCP